MGKIPRSVTPQAAFAGPVGVVRSTGLRSQAAQGDALGGIGEGFRQSFIQDAQEQKAAQDTSYVSNVMADEVKFLFKNFDTHATDPAMAETSLTARLGTVVENAGNSIGPRAAAGLESSILDLHARQLGKAFVTRQNADRSEAYFDANAMLDAYQQDYAEVGFQEGFGGLQGLNEEIATIEETITQVSEHAGLEKMGIGVKGDTGTSMLIKKLDTLKLTAVSNALSNQALKAFNGEELNLGFTSEGRKIVGKTVEGRPVIQNDDGTVVSENAITVTDPGINDGKPTNIPTIYDGVEISSEEALKRAIDAGGKDSETGRQLIQFKTIDEAKQAATDRATDLDVNKGQAAADRVIQEFIGNEDGFNEAFGLGPRNRELAAQTATRRVQGMKGLMTAKEAQLAEAFNKGGPAREGAIQEKLLEISTNSGYGLEQAEIDAVRLIDPEKNSQAYVGLVKRFGDAVRQRTGKETSARIAEEKAKVRAEDTRKAQEDAANVQISIENFVTEIASQSTDLTSPLIPESRILAEIQKVPEAQRKAAASKIKSAQRNALVSRQRQIDEMNSVRKDLKLLGKLPPNARNQKYTDNAFSVTGIQLGASVESDDQARTSVTGLVQALGLIPNQVKDYLITGVDQWDDPSSVEARLNQYMDIRFRVNPNVLNQTLPAKAIDFYEQLNGLSLAGENVHEAIRGIYQNVYGDKTTRDLENLSKLGGLDAGEYIDANFTDALQKAEGGNSFMGFIYDIAGVGGDYTPEMKAATTALLNARLPNYERGEDALATVANTVNGMFNESIYNNTSQKTRRPMELNYPDKDGSVHYARFQLQETINEIAKRSIGETLPSELQIIDDYGSDGGVWMREHPQSRHLGQPSYQIYWRDADSRIHTLSEGGVPVPFKPDPARSKDVLERIEISKNIRAANDKLVALGVPKILVTPLPAGHEFRVEVAKRVLDIEHWLKRKNTPNVLEAARDLNLWWGNLGTAVTGLGAK